MTTPTKTRPPAILAPTPTGHAPGGTNDTRSARTSSAPIDVAPNGANTWQATDDSTPILVAPAGKGSRPTNAAPAPAWSASGGKGAAGRHLSPGAQYRTAVGEPGPAAKADATTIVHSLLDPALSLAADVLDDIERVRIANENRLRQLTRSEEDSDGEVRGFGLDATHPDVARLAAIVDTLKKVEHDATLQLQRQLRRHQLGAWMKAQRGIGEKQGARLLAAIGDPYIRPEIAREDGTVLPAGPRTVSALWAYCGFHTLPVSGHSIHDGQRSIATDGAYFPAGQGADNGQTYRAGRDQLAARHPGHAQNEAHVVFAWVAARRQRGQRANWSTKAKTRAYLIAESCLKAGGPYRDVYDKRKAHTEGRTHAAPCAPCGSKGKPAAAGSAWRDGHRHADALRIAAKTILRDLWREARRIHLGETS